LFKLNEQKRDVASIYFIHFTILFSSSLLNLFSLSIITILNSVCLLFFKRENIN